LEPKSKGNAWTTRIATVIFGATAVISVLRGETTQTYAIGSFVALGVLSGILSFKEMMETFNKTVK
jgi:hypothetical protein